MKAVINVKTEPDVKKNAQEVASQLGLSLSAVLNAYLRQFVRNREIHLSLVPQMSPKLEKFLEKAEKDITKRKNFSGPFSSAKELADYFAAL